MATRILPFHLRTRRKGAAFALLVGLSAVLIACSGGEFTSGDMAGDAGSSGSAGSSIGGSSSGDSGQAGAGHGGRAGASSSPGMSGGAGDAGSAGTGGAPPCDGSCSGKKSVCLPATNTCVECADKSTCTSPRTACDATTHKCVECIDKSTCSGSKPACDTTKNACVECTTKTDCTNSAEPLCDPTAETCVACLRQGDCISATASACNAGTCAACTKDSECSDIAGKGVCNAGTCVQCTGTKFAACGLSTGTPLVCDSLQHTCTSDKQASAGLCQSCVSDAECTPGKICVLDKFGTPSKNVGYFCHWKQGDTADGAPADCFSLGQPYAGVQQSAVSIDGATSDICSLAASTCVALNEFRSKNCANPTLPDDSLCGVNPPKDAKCVQFGATTYRCTMTCLSDDDCPGTACDKGVSPFVCKLN